MYNPFNPFIAGMPMPLNVNLNGQRRRLKRIDAGGIYKLSTNSVVLDATASQVAYGINPCDYRELPCESLILLTIHADVPAGGEGFPVHIAIPTGNTTATTVTTTGSTPGTGSTRVPVVDSQGNNVTGANVSGNTERLLYLDKRRGVARFVEFTNPAAAQATPAG